MKKEESVLLKLPILCFDSYEEVGLTTNPHRLPLSEKTQNVYNILRDGAANDQLRTTDWNRQSAVALRQGATMAFRPHDQAGSEVKSGMAKIG
jgi:hypothetical protein